MLVYPSSIDLPSRTLRHLTEQLTVRQREMGTRWRRLPVGRQALLALAHLRCGDIHAQLAAGFGIGIATVYRQYTRAIEVLAALAPTPRNHRRPRGCQAEMLADKASVLPVDGGSEFSRPNGASPESSSRIPADTWPHRHRRRGRLL